MKVRMITGFCALLLAGSGCGDDDKPKSDTSDATDTTGETSAEVTPDTTPDSEPETEPDTALDSEPDVADSDAADTSQNPAPPALGALIDRLGRPAIATALIGTFDPDATAKGALKDAYNSAEPEGWSGYAAEMAKNLAIYDSADTVCGNQLLAGPTLTEARYGTLSGALADDRLYLNTTGATCTTYLAVEANAVGIVVNADCGGRKPAYDVIDITYSVVTIGGLSGIGDAIARDDGAISATFPYLDEPGPAFPSPPPLGSLVDRLGRPAVATALIGAFESDATAKGMLKDQYNASEQADWSAWAGEMAASLAIYDSADTVCGNQLLASPTLVEGRYGTLAGALSDDRLYLNTAGATCTTYLAVEANAVGILANADCGGRKPAYDVIDTTYSVVVAGAFGGVSDGISADDGTVGASFPFLDEAGAPPE